MDARLAIAADGADSTLRELAGLQVSAHDYAQRGVVAFVDTEASNEATAWQRFLPSGPLAFLPFVDGRSSIVWTLPDSEAERVLALDDDAFNRELTLAFAAPVSYTHLDGYKRQRRHHQRGKQGKDDRALGGAVHAGRLPGCRRPF